MPPVPFGAAFTSMPQGWSGSLTAYSSPPATADASAMLTRVVRRLSLPKYWLRATISWPG